MLKKGLSNFGWYFDKAADNANGQPPAAPELDGTTANAAGAEKPKSGDDKPKMFTQDEVDAVVKERLKREADKAEKAAQKAKEEAEAKALEEQKEFQKLAEKQKAQLAELTQRVSELEPLSNRYAAALTKFRDAQASDVPEHLKPLLEKLDVVEQIEWLAANKDKLKATPQGVPATPPPADPKDLDEATKKIASAQATRFYAGQF